MGTPENAGRSYNYYAFISYSHADKAWASWIQKSLERSRIPAAISRDEPSVPRRISPVFRDDTDLVSHGSVLEVLKKELEDSRFLIVICSPDSAKSSWVSDEIQAFIDMGRADRIIPLIVRGVPHSKDPETECLPPALLTLDREAEPLGIDVQEHGKNGAYVRVVASLLGVKLDHIIQRDRKIRRRKRIACVSLAIAALAIAGFLVWYNVPFVSLYRDYTDRWDIPAGIGRITASEQAKTAVSYRFTTRRGRVESVERINSAGVLTEGEFAQIWTEPALVRCQYADTGLFRAELIGKEYYSADHKKLYSVQYTRRDGSRQRAADLIMPGESVSAFSATARTSDASAGVDLASLMQSDTEMRYRSMISRYLQTYDESGFLITRLYMRDNWNHPVSDDDDIYGVQFGYDADGRVTRIRYLDADGNVSGCLLEYAGEDYEYDPEGRIVRITRVDSGGSPVIWALSYVTQVIEYDETGRPSRIVCLDRSGNPMPSPDFGNATGVSIVRDAQGNILRTVFLGTGGNPAACIGGFAEIRRTFDASGRATSESTYDADGNPVADQSGVYTYAYTYDGAGSKTYERIDWSNGDRIVLAMKNDEVGMASQEYSVNTISVAGVNSKTDLMPYGAENGLEWGTGTHDFWAGYPASKVTVGNHRMSATIPSSQVVTYSKKANNTLIFNPDMSDAFMVAGLQSPQDANGINLDFYPAFTCFEFTVGANDNTTITSFEMETSTYETETAIFQPIAGVSTATFDAGSGMSCTYTGTGSTSSTIGVVFHDDHDEPYNPIISTTTSINFKVFALPLDITGVKITFNMSNGTSKSLRLKQNDAWITFPAATKIQISGLAVPGAVWFINFDYPRKEQWIIHPDIEIGVE